MNTLKKKMNKKGFTLAELLIVVAIIAVLVAISIPIFSTQLEKSKESTDLANIRAAYAEAMTAALDSDDNTGSADTVSMTQGVAGWDHVEPVIASNINISEDGSNTDDKIVKPVKNDTIKVSIAADGSVTFVKN